jgi:hypothetical protein
MMMVFGMPKLSSVLGGCKIFQSSDFDARLFKRQGLTACHASLSKALAEFFWQDGLILRYAFDAWGKTRRSGSFWEHHRHL